jgi:outer membrane receptor protein involved in Fe transport
MAKADLEVSFFRFALGGSLRYYSRMQNIDKIFTSGVLDLAFPPGLGIQDYRNYHDRGDIIVDTRLSANLPHDIKLSFIVKNVFNHIYMQRPADMQPPRTFALQAGIVIK